MSKVSIQKVSMIYIVSDGPDVHALDKVPLDISEAEIVTVLGLSGCGKTTLLNIIAGFLSPSSGQGSSERAPSKASAWTGAWCSSRAHCL